MAIFELNDSSMSPLSRTSLAAEAVQERRDLQRMLQARLSELLPDILVIAEEFGDWDDSRRRIDLLALDREANIVVIELKRGDTGIHMELQAVRYAAMVSKITFDQAVETYARYKGTDIDDGDARAQILEFLDWADPSEEDFGRDVKIVLFSEDYSRELTSSILWLNEKGVEITCFRMSAYKLAERLLLDFSRSFHSRKRRNTKSRCGTSSRLSNRSGVHVLRGMASSMRTSAAANIALGRMPGRTASLALAAARGSRGLCGF